MPTDHSPLEESGRAADPTRRLLVLGAATLGIVATLPSLIGQAMATAPVVPGVKPDQPFRLGPGLRPGLKPDQPVRPDGVLDVAQASGPPRPVVVHRPGSAASSSTRLVVHRVPATVRPGDVRDRALYLDNVNTGETLKVAYLDNGRYLPKALKAINWLMRDRRTDEVVSIDVGLLDLLSDLAKTLDTRQPIRIVSGYRSPQTNRAMRARNRSVARKSYHTRGMAADIAVPGVDVPSLFRVAVAMGRGGVGDYPGSGFVHVDVGPRRTW